MKSTLVLLSMIMNFTTVSISNSHLFLLTWRNLCFVSPGVRVCEFLWFLKADNRWSNITYIIERHSCFFFEFDWLSTLNELIELNPSDSRTIFLLLRLRLWYRTNWNYQTNQNNTKHNRANAIYFRATCSSAINTFLYPGFLGHPGSFYCNLFFL